MTAAFLGEIRITGFSFAPRGWALCEGQVLPISQNTALFSILGVTYGGDGRATFALPDLRGMSPLGAGTAPDLTPRSPGDEGGLAQVALREENLPPHRHSAVAAAAIGSGGAQGATWAPARYGRVVRSGFSDGARRVAMSPSALQTVGESSPHENMPPSLAMNFIIALAGVFPPRP